MHITDQAYKNWLQNDDTHEFALYSEQYYLKCPNAWAYCHRKHAGLNTNLHIERMHKTLKYIYLHGKNVKRRDKSIHAIMRFVRDKLVDRLIILKKGKISSKIKELRKRHKTSSEVYCRTTITRDANENKWNISSSSWREVFFLK